jgi:hypothetical protein
MLEARLFGELPEYAAVSDGAGGVIVAYDDRAGRLSRDTGLNHVNAQRLNGEGEKLWGDGVSVVPNRPFHFLSPALFPVPDGGAIVAVAEYRGHTPLVFQRLAADGRTLWGVEGRRLVGPRSLGELESVGPVFGSLDDGVLRLAWDHDSAEYLAAVRFSAFDAAGNRLVPGGGIQLTRPMLRNDFLIRDFAYDPATDTSFVLWSNGAVAAAVLYSSR